MQIKTNATDRKKLVKAIADHTGNPAIYMGSPTFAYQVGEYTVDRYAIVTTENEEKGAEILEMLQTEGFVANEAAEPIEETTTDIKIPLTDFTPQGIINLINMLYSKQHLINRSIGKENFKIEDALVTALADSQHSTADEVIDFISEFGTKGIAFADGCISFLGFPTDADTIKAYMELMAAMVKTSKEAGKVKAKQTIEENEKYYMRVWLVRLGFDGKDAKETRRVLLENLKGHTAFRTEADRQKWNERQKERKAREVQ